MRKFVIRLFAVLLSAAVLLCGLTGCESNQTGNSDSDSISSDSQVNSDNTDSSDSQNEQNSQSEFNFDEAVKNITLFGKKISLPCTVKDLGEDFSVGGYPLQTSDGGVVCSIYYKNERLGSLGLADCSIDDNFDDKQITFITLGFGTNDKYENLDDSLRELSFQRSGWYSGLIDINFGGVTFKSTLDEVKNIMGLPDTFDTSTGELLGYDYSELEYRYSDNEYVKIAFYSTRITEILINL